MRQPGADRRERVAASNRRWGRARRRRAVAELPKSVVAPTVRAARQIERTRECVAGGDVAKTDSGAHVARYDETRRTRKRARAREARDIASPTVDGAGAREAAAKSSADGDRYEARAALHDHGRRRPVAPTIRRAARRIRACGIRARCDAGRDEWPGDTRLEGRHRLNTGDSRYQRINRGGGADGPLARRADAGKIRHSERARDRST